MGTYSLLYDTDLEIITEYCESKSHRAANALVRKYRSFVYFTALRYVKNEYDADDIAQDVFVKTLNNLHKYKHNSDIKVWLYAITVNHSKNHLRKSKLKSFFRISNNDENFDIEDELEDRPDSKLENKELSKLLLEAMEELPEKQREVFSLRYFDNIPYNEISKLLGTSVGGLKANYHHAVKKLAEKLNGEL